MKRETLSKSPKWVLILLFCAVLAFIGMGLRTIVPLQQDKVNKKGSADFTAKAPYPPSPPTTASSQRKRDTEFSKLIDRALDRSESAYNRIYSIQMLVGVRGSMSGEELDQIRVALYKIAQDSLDEPHVVASAIHELSQLILYLKDTHQLSDNFLASFSELVSRYAVREGTNLDIRGEAIRSLGDLHIANGDQIAAQLLETGDNVNIQQIARTSCLTLLKLSGEHSLESIQSVSTNTSDPSVFGTAAYCLGRINTPAAMSILVKNELKFPNSESSDAALVNMEDVILSSLEATNSHVNEAIEATKHLWKDGQQERYIPALLKLAASGSAQTRSLAVERILDLGSTLPLQQEKTLLSHLLNSIGQSSELSDYLPIINSRLSAAPAMAVKK